MERQEIRNHRHGIVKRLVDRLFPERQIIVRTEGRVSFIRVPRWIQVFLVVLVAGSGAWMAFTSVSFVVHERIVAGKDNQIADARLRYHVVIGQIAEYQRRFRTTINDLEENHTLMLGLVERNAYLQENLASIETQLKSTRADRATIIRTRERLKNELTDLQNNMSSLASHNYALRGNLDNVESGLQSALVERNRALFEGNRMRVQIEMLEARLGDIEESQQEAVQRLNDRAVAEIDSIEKLVKLTGLKIEQLIKIDGGVRKAQGGPFIAARSDGVAGGNLKADLANLHVRLEHWQALDRIARRLPLTSPLK